MKKIKNVNYSREISSVPSISYLYTYYVPVILSVLSFIFYKPSLYYNFQFDDLANITKLYSIRNAKFSDLFFQSSRWISYWINTIHYKIGKFNPFSYRLLNVVGHSLTGIIIFYLFYIGLSNLKKRPFFAENAFPIALCSAVLFLLHPVQTQTVSYVIQGQLEGFAGLFIVSVILCFLLRSRSSNFVAKLVITVAAFILGALSCGTKEIAIISPLLVVLFDWFFIAQGDLQSLQKRLVLYGVYFLVIFSLYLYFLKPSFFINLIGMKIEARNNIGNILTENQNDKILPLHFFISQFKVILHYLFIFVWPFNISVEYDWKLVKSFFSLDCFIPLLVLCSLFFVIAKELAKDKANILLFGLVWFFISIAPRAIYPSSELIVDYKTYTGSIGVLFFLSVVFVRFCDLCLKSYGHKKLKLSPNTILCSIVILLGFALGWLTYERNKVWSTAENFWYSIIQNAPGKARAYNNYAVALSEKGLYKESIPYYQKAIDMDNKYADPLNNIAVAYSCIGDLDKAIEVLKKSIMVQPMYPEAYNNLASFLINKKEYDQAEKVLSYALQLRPYYGKAYFNLGKVYLFKDDQEKAFECFKNACTKADLDNETGFQLYAHMAMKLKKYQDAIFALGKMIEMQPSKENYFSLAHALFLNEEYSKSVGVYKKLLTHHPDERNAWYNLGETYLKLNDPQQALYAFEKAQDLKHTVPNLPLRIAYCHKLLHNFSQTEKILEDVLKQPSMPEQFKLVARNELKQLKNSSPDTKQV